MGKRVNIHTNTDTRANHKYEILLKKQHFFVQYRVHKTHSAHSTQHNPSTEHTPYNNQYTRARITAACDNSKKTHVQHTTTT